MATYEIGALMATVPPIKHPLPKNDEVFVFFYKGDGTLLDKLTRWWTLGKYSHCEVVTSQWVYSSTPQRGGLWQEAVGKDTCYLESEWDVVKISSNPAQIDNWFMSHWGKYDYLGVFGLMLRPIKSDKDKYFCSEAVASSIGFEDGWRYDPNTLYSALKPLRIN